MPRPPKYDVKQAADLHIRLTAEQKQQLVQASQVSSAGTIAPFIHQLAEHVAPLIIDLNESRLSPEQFKELVGNAMLVLATPSVSASASPSPSPENEGGDGE